MKPKKSNIWEVSFPNMTDTHVAPMLFTRTSSMVFVHQTNYHGKRERSWLVKSHGKSAFQHIDDRFRHDFPEGFPHGYPELPAGFYLQNTDTILGLDRNGWNTYVIGTELSWVEMVTDKAPTIEPISVPSEQFVLSELHRESFGLGNGNAIIDVTRPKPKGGASLRIERWKVKDLNFNNLRFLFMIFNHEDVYLYVHTETSHIFEIHLSDYQFQRFPTTQHTDSAYAVASSNGGICNGIWKVWGSHFFKIANDHDMLYMDIKDTNKRHTLFIATDIAHFEFSCVHLHLHKINQFSSSGEYIERIKRLLKTEKLGR